MANRKDDRYVCLRVTDDEREEFDEKLRKTGLTEKAFLKKCIRGEIIRELAPNKASDIHHQLSKIDTNLMELASVRNNLSPKMFHLYDARYKQFHKIITDITTVIYLARLNVDDSSGWDRM